MKNRLIFFLLLTIYSLSDTAEGQTTHTVFSDTVTNLSDRGEIRTGFGIDKFIYLSGSSFGDVHSFPTVTKTDTSGSVIWTASDYENLERFINTSAAFRHNFCKSTFKSGNELFTIAEKSGLSGPNEIWAISDETGNLKWKTTLNDVIIKVVDYSSSEIIAISGTSQFIYYRLNKATGAITFSKRFGSSNSFVYDGANVLVDQQKNILLSWSDSCQKFRDGNISNLLFTSNSSAPGNPVSINVVLQDSGRYLMLGQNVVMAVDSLSGSTLWLKRIQVGYIQGVQSGSVCKPKDYFIKDSLLYITWQSPSVGSIGLNKGFTLSCVNTGNGSIKFNVAHDFTGVPSSPPVEALDWPVSITMDAGNQIYMTGAYDNGAGPDDSGNWGLMKLNGQDGHKIYETTITRDPSVRMSWSKGRFVYYFNNRMYMAGSLQDGPSNAISIPSFISFDTTAFYSEFVRKRPVYNFRFPSALAGAVQFSENKFSLLKKIGRSAVVEFRTASDQLINKTVFNRPGKFFVPQMIKNLGDTAIAASFILLAENERSNIVPGIPDSLIFVRIDSSGNLRFRHSIKLNITDTFRPAQVYTDNRGKVNFVFTRRSSNYFQTYAYQLGSNNAVLSGTGNIFSTSNKLPVLRQEKLRYYRGDSTIFFYPNDFGTSSGYINSSVQGPANYPFGGFKTIPEFKSISSAIMLDSLTYFLMGADPAGKMLGGVLNFRLPTPLIWTASGNQTGEYINCDSSSTAFYLISRKADSSLGISKVMRSGGSNAWEYLKSPSLHSSINSVDFAFNKYKNQFIVGGFICDTLPNKINYSWFILALDTSGNELSFLTEPGYGPNQGKIAVTAVLKNGSNLYGGSTGDATYGPSGFYNRDCALSADAPSVVIAASQNPVCANQPVTFTAVITGEGNQPHYQWLVNDLPAGSNQNVFVFTSPVNNDRIKLQFISENSCSGPVTVLSNVVVINVSAQVTHSVTVTSNASVICSGDAVTFTAAAVNSGTNPIFQWTLNGIPSGQNNNTFTTSALTAGSIVSVNVISSSGCAVPAAITTIAPPVLVNSSLPIGVTVTPATFTGCPGVPATFMANVVNGGTSPVYNWTKNGVNAGTNSSVFVVSNPAENDIVKVTVNSNQPCASPAAGNAVTLHISTDESSVQISGQNMVAAGSSSVISAAATGITSPVFRWEDSTALHAWSAIPGAVQNQITYSPQTLGDKIRVVVTGSPNCGPPVTKISNAISFTITAYGRTQGINLFYLHPNPARAEITADSLQLAADWASVSVVSSTGIILKTITGLKGKPSVTVDLKGYGEGIYILVLRKANGEFLTRRFVKM